MQRELGPSGYTVYKRAPLMQEFNISRTNSIKKRSNVVDAHDYSRFLSKLPPLPVSSSIKLNSDSPPSRKTSSRSAPDSVTASRSRHPSTTYHEPALSRRPSIGYETNYLPPRPFSASYDLRSARASPIRELPSLSRRNSFSRLPRPEPSPMRELPPTPPKQKIRHYPLPPPSYTEGMIALSRRMRNRSASPAPNYSEMELSTRPAIISAALGRPTPSKEMIRMTICGPPMRQYHLGRNIWRNNKCMFKPCCLLSQSTRLRDDSWILPRNE